MLNELIGSFKITTRELKHDPRYKTTIFDLRTKKKKTFLTETESGAAYIAVLFLRDYTVARTGWQRRIIKDEDISK